MFNLDPYQVPNTHEDIFSLTESIYEDLPPVFFIYGRAIGLFEGT